MSRRAGLSCRGRIVDGILVVLVQAPVILIRAGLHLRDDLRSGPAGILRQVTSGNDIDFSDGINRRLSGQGRVITGSLGGYAVH